MKNNLSFWSKDLGYHSTWIFDMLCGPMLLKPQKKKPLTCLSRVEPDLSFLAASIYPMQHTGRGVDSRKQTQEIFTTLETWASCNPQKWAGAPRYSQASKNHIGTLSKNLSTQLAHFHSADLVGCFAWEVIQTFGSQKLHTNGSWLFFKLIQPERFPTMAHTTLSYFYFEGLSANWLMLTT